MRPSPWPCYCAAVAEMTGLDTEFIWAELPLAVGRQYEAVYYQKYRVRIITVGAAPRRSRQPGLQKIVR